MGQSRGCDGRKSRTDKWSAAAEAPRKWSARSLICHGGLWRPIPMALLTKAMGLPARLASRWRRFSLMSPPTPYGNGPQSFLP
jgi:hypothetical protein